MKLLTNEIVSFDELLEMSHGDFTFYIKSFTLDLAVVVEAADYEWCLPSVIYHIHLGLPSQQQSTAADIAPGGSYVKQGLFGRVPLINILDWNNEFQK